MGTPDFAVPSLRALLEAGHNVLRVFTQPDRPRGRGQRPSITPVKAEAIQNGLTVLQPERLSGNSVTGEICDLRPDVIVVVAYGQKIPRSLLLLPPFGCINVHASLLPKYRGAAPIHWAIINGEKETGITTMWMDEGWDTGDILLQRSVPIDSDMDVQALHDRLATGGAELLAETLEGLPAGVITRKPQDHAAATLAPKLEKIHGCIDWSHPSATLLNRIRGMTPWPGAYTSWNGRTIRVWKAQAVNHPPGSSEDELRTGALPPAGSHTGEHPYESLATPGCITQVDRAQRRIAVQAGDGPIWLQEVQPENGKRMSALDFLNGYRLTVGERLG